jgi:DNA-directed RNA polymerase I subunit RPA2
MEIKHKDNENAYVETVRIIGVGSGTETLTTSKSNLRRVSITMRYRRNPIIGDKFSSRHGQKGTLSVLWPQENMPFTESGMTPDVLINPHAFPSRMTIGMLIESMAGKSGALNGNFQDGTPFQFHEERRAIDHMGEQLRANGYSYYGSEPLYNGLTGNIMHVDIFIGVVFYQRLRHMVNDKFQVRSTGPVVALTRQPVKGRKKHGGIRLGEMERDSLLSHGVAFCVQDRLMNCSDSHLAYVCSTCGSLLTVYSRAQAAMRYIAGIL